MSTLSHHFTVEAPADAVWEVIGRRFDRIGDWATIIPRSAAAGHTMGDAAPAGRPTPSGIVDAPVAGRVCHTGVRLLPQITETITAYDDAARTPDLPGQRPAPVYHHRTQHVDGHPARRPAHPGELAGSVRHPRPVRRPRRRGDPHPGRARSRVVTVSGSTVTYMGTSVP
jgi:hypothetical protein